MNLDVFLSQRIQYIHPEEGQVMEIGVVSRKKGKLTFAKADYSQLPTCRLREDKMERKIFNVRTKIWSS